MNKWLDLTKEAFEASSAFMDANYREDWSYSLRAFRNEHAEGSKYLTPEYASRSRLFRPKTRSVIRKNEAAGAVALFSNSESVIITPGNSDDQMSVAAAAADKELLEFRLSRTIPTFPLVMGALQDAQTQGMVCSYQYWEYEVRNGVKIKDKPCIELRPIENIRLDGGASWLDPVETSPYFCDIIPMYVCQVRGMMANEDPKTKWKKYEDSVILRAKPDAIDSTMKARLGKQQDPQDETTGIKDFDIVWVMRWCMRDSQNDDHCFYTLGTEELLTDAKPINEVYFTGKRPYVMGYAILETHRVMKTSVPMLVKSIQQETNEIANQRIDNVKFVLNKRWLVARGRQTDVNSLVRNVPGGVTLTTDPKTDIQESNWPDVTSSSYAEQDRLSADFDDLAGNFTPSTKVANNAMNDTLGGAKLATQGAGLMTDYLLRTFIETWWEPVLRQVLLLEREYETDETVLAVCANKARLFQRFGVSAITDDLLAKEVNVSVNVGMGASNPQERFQKLMGGTNMVMDTVAKAPPNFNVQEFIKEAYSNMGYRDGSRFWSDQADPRLAKAMQMIQQLQQALNGKQMELQANGQIEQQKLLSNERVKEADRQVDEGRIRGDLQIRAAELVVEQQKLKLEEMKLQLEAQKIGLENRGLELEHRGMAMEQAGAEQERNARMAEAQKKLEAEHLKMIGQVQKISADIEKAQLDVEKAKAERDNEGRVVETASKVNQAMTGAAKQMTELGQGLKDLNKGLGALLGLSLAPKKKPKGFKLRKSDGKNTNAVVVEYDDDSVEEMQVGRA